MKGVLLSLGVFALASFGLASCSKKDQAEVVEQVGRRQYDVVYGSDAANTLDIALPAEQAGEVPFAILVHGGGWIAGNKEDMHGFQEQLLKMGIGSVSINYRYANTTNVHCREMMDDVNGAVTYCVRHAQDWGVRHNRFVLVGASAGAHMSLLYAYKHDLADKIAGVVSLSGPTDFTDKQWLSNYGARSGLLPAIQMVTNDVVPRDGTLPPSYVAASPIYTVKNIPTLLIHGAKDTVVNYEQAYNLNQQLQLRGFASRLITIENAGHNLNMDQAVTTQMVFDEIAKWVVTYSE
jgi:acetyl esterase/lipase